MFKESEEQIIKIDSVISPRQIAKLYFKPKVFFRDFIKLDMKYIHFATYLVAVFFVMDRIDVRILTALSSDTPNYSSYSFVLENWLNYWLVVIGIGGIASFIVWFFYGWWYEVRLKWSGVQKPNSILVRQVNVIQWLIVALPVVLVTIIQTFIYDNYLNTFFSDEIVSSFVISFFSIYSCWTNYLATKVLFLADKRAILWFLILPMASYVLAIIALIKAFTGS